MMKLRKLACCTLVLVLLGAVLCPLVAAEPVQYGDAILDGSINVLDVTAVLDHSTGTTLITGDAFIRADVNFDGVVDVEDALKIMLFIVGEIDSLSPSASGEEGDVVIL